MRKCNEILFLVLIGVSILISCNEKNDCKIIKINTKDTEREIKLSSIAYEPKLIKLYADNKFMIGDVRQIKYIKKIYIQNLQKILVFNNDGSPAYDINNQGKANGEYYEINDFYVDTLCGIVEIWDRVRKQMVYFNDQTGSFIRAKKIDIDASYFKKVKNNYFFYCNAAYSSMGEKASRIVCLDINGNIKNEFLRSDYIKLYAFNTPGFLSIVNNEILYDDAPLNTIYKITEDDCLPVYKINIDNKSMNLEELLSMKELRPSERDYRMNDLCSYSIGNTSFWNNGIYLEIKSNGKWYQCFYNNSGEVVIGTGLFNDYKLNLSVWYGNICDNKIICYLPAYKIKKEFKGISSDINQTEDFYKIIKTIDKFDNPVLFVSELK